MDQNYIKEKFISLYQTNPIIVKAPGRINIIGEHTDYNNGFVLPAAINRNIYLAIQKNYSDRIRIYAANLNESIDISSFEVIKQEKLWANYLLGAYQELINDGNNLTGFDCVFGGDLPIGSGLSSSAAIECGLIYGLNQIFKLELTKLQMAKLGQLAEHNFVGVKCGLMDQYAVMFGKKDQLIKLDCKTNESKYVNIDLKNYSIILVNSNVKHSLASSEYNTRRLECQKGVELLRDKYKDKDIETLRDFNLDQLQKLRNTFNTTVYNRCEYVIEENERVLDFISKIETNELLNAGKLMNKTHLGLQYKYEVSCTEIDILVKEAEKLDYVIGSRMMGGGFGGCTINFVANNKIQQFKETISKIYLQKTNITPDFYTIEITNGVEILN